MIMKYQTFFIHPVHFASNEQLLILSIVVWQTFFWTSTPALCSSHAVRRAPWRRGRVSVAQTRTADPRRRWISRRTPSAVPPPPVAGSDPGLREGPCGGGGGGISSCILISHFVRMATNYVKQWCCTLIFLSYSSSIKLFENSIIQPCLARHLFGVPQMTNLDLRPHSSYSLSWIPARLVEMPNSTLVQWLHAISVCPY